MKRILPLAFLSFALSACNTLQSNADEHTTVCNELKRQIIYNGATLGQSPRAPAPANQPLATQQRAQLDKANASYNQMGC